MANGFNFLDFLNEEPRLAYYSALQQQGLTPRQNRYFYEPEQYFNAHNRYLGALGTQILGGQAPTLRFTDFLAQMPFEQRYMQLPPEYRPGGLGDPFNPRTIWNVR